MLIAYWSVAISWKRCVVDIECWKLRFNRTNFNCIIYAVCYNGWTIFMGHSRGLHRICNMRKMSTILSHLYTVLFCRLISWTIETIPHKILHQAQVENKAYNKFKFTSGIHSPKTQRKILTTTTKYHIHIESIEKRREKICRNV